MLYKYCDECNKHTEHRVKINRCIYCMNKDKPKQVNKYQLLALYTLLNLNKEDI
jgi:hypothetical protein